ncbi:MAG: hypothetical protein IPN90_03650 [Elusimicrobia bacterium]|nr:hypothetical protein [Elusimicrobiota bacterium]
MTPPGNRKASRAARKKLVPRLKNPGAGSFEWNGKPAAPALGDAPANYGRGKDQAAARPAQKTCAGRAALFSLTVGLSGARSDSGRFGFRENPRHRTRGVPHVELARPAFSATVTVPLRLRWRAARWPGATTPRRPGLAPLAEGCRPARRKKTGFRQVAPHGTPKPAPHGFAVSAVRAGGPVLVPSRGGARKPSAL